MLACSCPFALRRHPLAGAILDPYFIGGYGLPKLALAPLFILWFGIDLEPKVALVASDRVVFGVLLDRGGGERSEQPIRKYRSRGASERDIARHIVWPGAIP
jgi:NitT/TauT family transport system permease protein